MLKQDKDLMRIHLDTIWRAICDLPTDNEEEIVRRLNCKLIDLREWVRTQPESAKGGE